MFYYLDITQILKSGDVSSQKKLQKKDVPIYIITKFDLVKKGEKNG